jgi:hypothetical protein
VHQRETLPFKRRKPKKLIISNAMVEVLRGFVKKRGKEKPRKPKQEKKDVHWPFTLLIQGLIWE